VSEATFWFSNPFREWIGQRTVTVRWEGRITLREVLDRLAADNSRFRANVIGGGLRQETFDNLAAVILDGDFLALDSVIPDAAKVDVLTPLAGGADSVRSTTRRRPIRCWVRLRMPTTPAFRRGDRVSLRLPNDPRLLPQEPAADANGG